MWSCRLTFLNVYVPVKTFSLSLSLFLSLLLLLLSLSVSVSVSSCDAQNHTGAETVKSDQNFRNGWALFL
jgi:hypothetical protein